MSLKAILKNDKTYTVVAAVSSAIAAIFACIAVFQTGSIFEAEREAKRPYFKIKNGTLQKNQEEQKFDFKIVLENIGNNPAVDPRLKLLVKNYALNSDLFWVAYDFADEIPKGATIYFARNNIETTLKETTLYYVLLAVKYFDPILKKNFAQLFLFQYRFHENKLERIPSKAER